MVENRGLTTALDVMGFVPGAHIVSGCVRVARGAVWYLLDENERAFGIEQMARGAFEAIPLAGPAIVLANDLASAVLFYEGRIGSRMADRSSYTARPDVANFFARIFDVASYIPIVHIVSGVAQTAFGLSNAMVDPEKCEFHLYQAARGSHSCIPIVGPAIGLGMDLVYLRVPYSGGYDHFYVYF